MICDHLGDLCPRCRHGWQNRSGTNSRSCFLSGRSFTRPIPSAATAEVSATGSSSTSSCNSCASAALTRRSPTRLARPPRSAAAATSGSDSACSPGSNRSRWSPTTGSSASPSITSLWTAPSRTKVRTHQSRPVRRGHVERTHAWQSAFYRLARCYERRATVIDAFFDLAERCAAATTRRGAMGLASGVHTRRGPCVRARGNEQVRGAVQQRASRAGQGAQSVRVVCRVSATDTRNSSVPR